MNNDGLQKFAVELFKINAIKFGEFKVKVGLPSPVYCDLRVIISYPKIMEQLAAIIAQYIKYLKTFDIICGVPYAALPIATLVSINTNIPMVIRRKEAKSYGTKQLIEGCYHEGNSCLILEDVVTSGSSILETVKDLKNCGIECTDALVLLNREQGGESFLEEKGIKMHALLTLTQLMSILRDANLITEQTVNKVQNYLRNTQVDPSLVKELNTPNRLKLSYEERSGYATNAIARKLFSLMEAKQTNLCVAADVTTVAALLNIAEQAGPHICLLKLHLDILEDFHPNCIKNLKDIAERHNFLLFEDRKYADIGKTVELQYSKGSFNVSSWIPLVTAHSLFGKGVLDGIRQSEGLEDRGIFLLAEASALENLITESYTQSTIKLASQYPDLIVGIVCQSPLFVDRPGLIQLTPGVKFESNGDGMGQQYNTPEMCVLIKGTDIAVVGRGITQAPNVAGAAAKYKQELWQAYLQRTSNLAN